MEELITFLTRIFDGSLSLSCKCRSLFDCLQSFLTVILYTVIEASLELQWGTKLLGQLA